MREGPEIAAAIRAEKVTHGTVSNKGCEWVHTRFITTAGLTGHDSFSEIDLHLRGAHGDEAADRAWGVICGRRARARLPVAEVYQWTVREPLPQLPIPLGEPHPEILIELAGGLL